MLPKFWKLEYMNQKWLFVLKGGQAQSRAGPSLDHETTFGFFQLNENTSPCTIIRYKQAWVLFYLEISHRRDFPVSQVVQLGHQ